VHLITQSVCTGLQKRATNSLSEMPITCRRRAQQATVTAGVLPRDREPFGRSTSRMRLPGFLWTSNVCATCGCSSPPRVSRIRLRSSSAFRRPRVTTGRSCQPDIAERNDGHLSGIIEGLCSVLFRTARGSDLIFSPDRAGRHGAGAGFDSEHPSAEPGEQPLSACEDNNLHPLGSACHDVEHAFNAVVIGKD
jgi:hypothetical protein